MPCVKVYSLDIFCFSIPRNLCEHRLRGPRSGSHPCCRLLQHTLSLKRGIFK